LDQVLAEVVERLVDKHQLDHHVPDALAMQKSESQLFAGYLDCPVKRDKSSFFAQEPVVAVAYMLQVDHHALDEQAIDFVRLSWLPVCCFPVLGNDIS
jgi:hypothetical protein